MKAEPTIPVQVPIPLHLYQPLARRAEARGHITVAAMLLDMATKSVEFSWDATGLRAMVSEGLTDADIATQTGELVNVVARHRRLLGLPANRRYGGARVQ